jgi:hypothetical protein
VKKEESFKSHGIQNNKYSQNSTHYQTLNHKTYVEPVGMIIFQFFKTMFVCDLYTNKGYIIIMYWCSTLVAKGCFFLNSKKKSVKENERSFGILEIFEMKISKLINYLVDMCYSCTTTYKGCCIGLVVGVQK